MGTFTLTKQNRLFWLGRYAERVYGSVRILMEVYDQGLDGGEFDYPDFCRRLGIPGDYGDTQDFFRRFTFDPDDPSSIRAAAEAMLGNGMVLREVLTSNTLAYLQMAHDALLLAQTSDSPGIPLQWVLDDIMAFRGSFDESVEDEESRNVVKAGGVVERISLMLRLEGQPDAVTQELRKLLNRLYKTKLPVDQEALAVVTAHALENREPDRLALLGSVEGLFLV